MNPTGNPETLIEAIKFFSNPDVARQFLIDLRWPEGVCCPECGSKKVGFIKTRKLWECKKCTTLKQFSVTVGTIFEGSHVKLDKWFIAIWLIGNAKNGISSYEIHRAIGVTQKTAWFMLHRIRAVMKAGSVLQDKIRGVVEVDESYIGGLARNMHIHTKEHRGITGTGMSGKTAVMGMLERGGKIVAEVLPGTPTRGALVSRVKKYVLENSEVHTDAAMGYARLYQNFQHHVVDHAECFVRGNVHTNGLENFWSLLKRGIKGTYVSVEPFHLFRYLSEQVFRFNERKDDDQGRFFKLVRHVCLEKMTYAQLTGDVAT